MLSNDKKHQLTISDTKGRFPGMLSHHTFNIVLVNGIHGSTIASTIKTDKTILYTGKAMSVLL